MANLIATGVKSALELGLDKFKTNVAAESVPNVLKKAGVKPDELKFSGIELPSSGKVSPEDMQNIVAGRTDKFGVTELTGTDVGYSGITVRGEGSVNPTYRERIYTFSQSGEPRYSSTHFPGSSDYLAHTRVHDSMTEGRPSRVVTELQSDLHQQGRAEGYSSQGQAESIAKADELLSSAQGRTVEEIGDEVSEVLGIDPRNIEGYISEFGELPTSARQILGDVSDVPESPWSKDWLAKTMEREYTQTVEDGFDQMLIPIKGAGVEDLARAEGVQKWYETQVSSTLKKLAKRTKADFDLVKLDSGGNVSPDGTLYARITIPGKSETVTEYIRQQPSTLDPNLIDSLLKPGYATIREAELRDAGVTEPDVKRAIELMEKPLTRETSEELYAITGNPVKDLTNTYYDLAAKYPVQGDGHLTFIDSVKLADELENSGVDAYSAEILSSGLPGTAMHEKTIGKLKRTPNADVPGKYKFTPEIAQSFNMYSSPAATAGVAYTAYKSGAEQAEVESYLVEEKGYSEADIVELRKQVSVIDSAIKSGETFNDAVKGLEQLEPTTTVENVDPEIPLEELQQNYFDKTNMDSFLPGFVKPSPEATAFATITSEKEIELPTLLAKLKILYPESTSIAGTDIPALVSQEARQRQAAAASSVRTHIVNNFAKYGIEVEYNEAGQLEHNGKVVEESFWEGIKAEGVMNVSTIAAGIAGFTLTPAPHPVPKLIGGAIAATAAAFAGSYVDYARTAYELEQEMSAQNAFYLARTNAEISAMGEVVLGVGGHYALALGKSSVTGAKRMYDFLLDGNQQGATEALLKHTYITPVEADEQVKLASKVLDMQDMNKEERRITALIHSTPQGPGIVNTASSRFGNTSSGSVKQETRQRAKDLLSMTADMSDPNAAKLFQQDLSNYIGDVKLNYHAVKDVALKSPNASTEFPVSDLAIPMLLKRIGADLGITAESITLDPVINKFMTQAAKIRSHANGRTMGDFIEMRQMLNDMLFNKAIVKGKSRDVLYGTVEKLDTLISYAADKTLGKGAKEWKRSYAEANVEYGKMKGVTRTAIYKMMFDKKGMPTSVNPQQVTDALVKHVNAMDGSYEAIISKLPRDARVTYEASTIDTLAKKYTIGDADAINFNLLDTELDSLELTTAEARSIAKSVKTFAEVFRNDPNLARLTNSLDMPSTAQGMATSITGKIQMGMMHSAYSRIKEKFSLGDGPNVYALASKVSKLLEEPRNVKNIKELQQEFFDDEKALANIASLTQQAAKDAAAGKDSGAKTVSIYAGGKLSGSGKPIAEIPEHRIATLADVQTIADAQRLTTSDPMLKQVLKKYGIKAVQSGHDRVEVLK